MADCKLCIHKPVCDLWRSNECQDASLFSSTENGCDFFLEGWIPVERLPDESCEVIIGKVDSDGNFYSVFGTSYSKKYQAFNVCDDFTDLEAEKVAIYPDFWKPMPAPIRKEVPSENP